MGYGRFAARAARETANSDKILLFYTGRAFYHYVAVASLVAVKLKNME
jgi:hypothetical protein